MPKSYSVMPANDNTTGNSSGFSQAINHEKNERVARTSLSDIMVFQKTLEEEIKYFIEEEAKGVKGDKELFAKMMAVKKAYQKILTSFAKLDNDGQRHALIVYADAVQDFITRLNRKG